MKVVTVKGENASVIPHGPEEGTKKTSKEKIGLEKEECLRQLKTFFESQPLAVLATQNGVVPLIQASLPLPQMKSLHIFFFRLRRLPGNTQTCWQTL